MHKLAPSAYRQVAPLFADMGCHLAVAAVLAGDAAGQVYADDPAHPRAALVRCGYRFYLAGQQRDGTLAALRRLFAEQFYPQGLAAGSWGFTLAYAPDDWQRALVEQVLAGKHPMFDHYQYYALRLQHDQRPQPPRPLPDGVTPRMVDRALLGETHLRHLDELREEMCSERPSVEDFLAHSFGVCLVRGDELVGWCLSEYNTGDRCEVGIATRESYRRQGLGTWMACALAEQARTRGIRRLGWHCYAANAPSVSTALKAGFALESEYAPLFAWFDETINLAINGNMRLQRGEYADALEWFERALAAGAQGGWVYWGAAQAAAAAGQTETALRYLRQALDRSAVSREQLETAERLRPLYDTPGWRALLAGLSA